MYPRIDVALSDVVFAVPTMKRPNNAEYLLATVESLLQHANTRPENIFLMSTGPEDHAVRHATWIGALFYLCFSFPAEAHNCDRSTRAC